MINGIRTRNPAFLGDNYFIIVDILGGSEWLQLRHQIAVDETGRSLVDVNGDTVRESLGAGRLTVCQSVCAIV